jgi:hypothetical protein
MKCREVGKLGADMTVEEGKLAARVAALAILSTVKAEVGDLDQRIASPENVTEEGCRT